MTAPKLTHQQCPECNHKGCLSIWDDGNMYCHSCGFTKGEPKTAAVGDLDPTVVLSEVRAYRNVPKNIVEKYAVKTGLDSTGTEVRREYAYPHRTKYRYLPKDFTKNLGFTGDHLFGMDKFAPGSHKTVTVVEGEDDALAAHFMLPGNPPVVSLPSGTISGALIQNCREYLDSFKEIVVCTDGDDTGKRAARRLAQAFPNKVFLVDLGTSELKDAQDYLAAKQTKDFVLTWNNRKKYVPSGYFNSGDQFESILTEENTNTFLPTPFDSLNELIVGLPTGHLVVLTGPEGQGKTEIIRAFEFHLLKHHTEAPIGVLHMEESMKTCLESYACYELGRNVRDPRAGVADAEVVEAVRDLTKDHNLYMFEFSVDEDPLAILDKVRYLAVACGCKYVFIDPIQQLAYSQRRDLTKDHNLYMFEFSVDEDPLAILDKVRYLAVACGCKYVFIDPIQQLAYSQRRDQTEEQVLSQIAVQLERLATDLDIGIVMTTHVNDDGQTRSSRMIGKSASIRIDLTRDHMNTDPEVANTTHLSVSKNRPVGTTGYGGALQFDPETFTLTEKV